MCQNFGEFSLTVPCPQCGAYVYPIDLGLGKVCRECWKQLEKES